MKNVVIFVGVIHNKIGGMERQLSRLINYLISNDFNVHLISLDTEDTNFYYPIEQQSRLFHHKLGGNKHIAFPRWIRLIVRQIKTIFLMFSIRSEFAVVFTVGNLPNAIIPCLISGKKIILSERISPSIYNYSSKKKYKKYDFFLMLFTTKIVVQLDRYKFYYWKILQSRIVSIPNFVFGNNNSLDIKLESKAPNFGIIYFGRFSFPKDLISMIKAFELFNPLFPNTTFDLYGNGEDLDFLRNYISHSKCASKINIYDPVQNMDQIIAKYSISCYLTFYDGFSNSVVESLAAGVPVIGYSNSDGVSDFIIDSVNGWLVHEFKNIDEIAKVYVKAYNQVNQDYTIFANSRKSVSQYVLNSHSSLWLDLLGN